VTSVINTINEHLDSFLAAQKRHPSRGTKQHLEIIQKTNELKLLILGDMARNKYAEIEKAFNTLRTKAFTDYERVRIRPESGADTFAYRFGITADLKALDANCLVLGGDYLDMAQRQLKSLYPVSKRLSLVAKTAIVISATAALGLGWVYREEIREVLGPDNGAAMQKGSR
jgi:hypothetical protein